jgi:hypothetical protein
MSNLFTPGPILIYARFRDANGNFEIKAQYLGTCILAPEPKHEYPKLEVFNDLGGRSVPFQLVHDGEQALIVLALNVFDINVVRRIRNHHSGMAPLGKETGYARGTIVVGYRDFQLILVNSYFGTVAAGTDPVNLNRGRLYYSCSCVQYEEQTQGTRVLEAYLGIQAIPWFNRETRGFQLYTEENSDIVPLLP